MCKRLSRWIKAIQELTASYPECAIAILEQRPNEYATEAVGHSRIINKHLEVVAVEPVQSVLSAEPHEALFVLHNLRDFCLRQPLRGGEALKFNVVAINYRKSDNPWIHLGLQNCWVTCAMVICAQVGSRALEAAQGQNAEQGAAGSRCQANNSTVVPATNKRVHECSYLIWES